jgi:hypothetical protein
MTNRSYLAICFSIFILAGCDGNEGLFGHSNTKEEAKANGSTVIEFVPDKTDFILLDGTKMQVDTAWTEISFTYHDGKKVADATYGYNFAIPYKRENRESFSFNFGLADITNRVFTNAREEKTCQLYPKILYDKIAVILEQKNPDTTFGWLKPIITDTILFTKIR